MKQADAEKTVITVFTLLRFWKDYSTYTLRVLYKIPVVSIDADAPLALLSQGCLALPHSSKWGRSQRRIATQDGRKTPRDAPALDNMCPLS
jgi:hypothetical protein